MSDVTADEARALLGALTGRPDAAFRPDQLEAILALVADRRRVLLVQRTGWGKSGVYFIATSLLRARGAGPTLLVSPLLALMRNQIAAAERMGIAAVTVNSTNRQDWDEVLAAIKRDDIDLLLVSAQRLANKEFQEEFLPLVGARSGLLVIDEAHCISDWGHDFVPDYRRIVRVLDLLPKAVPVLCCTATANDRVVDDVVDVLGGGFAPLRGPLGREGLSLHVLDLSTPAQRLAWLVSHLPRLPGSGIVYCLTKRDTERVASWLVSKGIDAVAYSGSTEGEERERVEQMLLANAVKCVVATSALGMGFDKPDLGFVVHYQAPGSAVLYYQQVGRAGRQIDESFGVLLRGAEDVDVQDWFIETAFPSRTDTERVLEVMEEAATFLTIPHLERQVNLRHSRLEHMLKVLEVEGAVERDGGRYRRTLNPYRYDQERVDAVTARRREEQRAMLEYGRTSECRMELLRRLLDDPHAEPCGLCDNCAGRRLDADLDRVLLAEATGHLRSGVVKIEPRKRWPTGVVTPSTIGPELRIEEGRVLSVWGDGGWSDLVKRGKHADGHFDDQLVEAAAEALRSWEALATITWITSVPSLRHPTLVSDFAARLGPALGLPVHAKVRKVRETKPQKNMENSAKQFLNIDGAFEVTEPIPEGAVLLVDDVVDSRWTITVVGAQLRQAGAAQVFPFALTVATGE